MTLTRNIVMALAISVGLVGCSSSSEGTGSGSGQAEPAPLNVSTAEELAQAIDCQEFAEEPDFGGGEEEGEAQSPVSRGYCVRESVDTPVRLSVYLSESDRTSDTEGPDYNFESCDIVSTDDATAQDSGEFFVVSDNFHVETEAGEAAAEVAAIFDGDILSCPPGG